MHTVKKKPIAARSTSVVKTAMGVLLTSAVLLLPSVRAEEAANGKEQDKPGTQLSKGEIKAQQQFKMLDFNQDGKLSRSEVAIIPKLAAAFDETDTNKDGFVNDADRYRYHSPMPDYIMGLSTSLRYKQLTLGIVTYEEVRAFAVKYRAAREKAKAAEALAAAQSSGTTESAHKSEAEGASPSSD